MLLHTGRSGLRPSDLCLFNTDLYRGPFPNNTPMNATQAFLMRNPCLIGQVENTPLLSCYKSVD